MISSELGFDVHLNRHRNMVLKQPIYPAVVLNLRYHHGKSDSCIPVIGSTAERGAIVVEDNPSASAILAVSAGNDHACYLLFG